MKDAFEAELYVQDFVVYVTLTGHKPILTRATVLEAEADRVEFGGHYYHRFGCRDMDWSAEARLVFEVYTKN
jgi:hypothetical protein